MLIYKTTHAPFCIEQAEFFIFFLMLKHITENRQGTFWSRKPNNTIAHIPDIKKLRDLLIMMP